MTTRIEIEVEGQRVTGWILDRALNEVTVEYDGFRATRVWRGFSFGAMPDYTGPEGDVVGRALLKQLFHLTNVMRERRQHLVRGYRALVTAVQEVWEEPPPFDPEIMAARICAVEATNLRGWAHAVAVDAERRAALRPIGDMREARAQREALLRAEFLRRELGDLAFVVPEDQILGQLASWSSSAGSQVDGEP